MFDNNDRDLCSTLSQMDDIARRRSNFDQVEAKQIFKNYVRSDRRFDQFDPDALVSRVMECKSHGATLDLADPRLQGKPARPLDKSNW